MFNQNTYNPYNYLGYNGQGMLQSSVQQNIYGSQPQNLIRVTGIDGAKAYQMPPNSVVSLFDSNEDIFYIKSTDGAGFPTINAFRFTQLEVKNENHTYVTREEFDELCKVVKQLGGNDNG